jgi:deoxyribonuclease V
MKNKILFNLPKNIKEGINIQNNLSHKVRLFPLKKDPENVLAIDCSYDKKEGITFVVGVKWSYSERKPIEIIHTSIKTSFPYITGLLSFRELPPIIRLLEKVNKIDLLLIDGQGILHPRGIGLASHVGILYDRPSIGVAKSRLTGDIKHFDPRSKGFIGDIYLHNKRSGFLYVNKENTKPLYISPGHLIDVNSIERILPRFFKDHRLPEPLFIADKVSKKIKNEKNT